MIGTSQPKAINIPSIDAKDLYLANHTIDPNPGGFTLKYRSGDVNINRFFATIPYSLDMIKLREVYDKVYRNTRFSFFMGEKEYSTRVINVTFNYSVKEFNKLGRETYIRNGYLARNVDFEDCVCVRNGELIGIKCGEPVEHPLPEETLGKFFFLQDGKYAAKTNITPVLSVADLRHELYDNGFDCDGTHYVRYKRSSGSSRVGKCLFVDEKMYSRLHRYDLCGLKVREGDKVDLAGFESYIALTSSSIIDTIQIDPASILMIDDYESVFTDRVVATGVRNGEIYTEYANTEVSNSIWDGQSLLQTETFGPYAQYGFVLLRNRFFKSACFNCDIQKFFADHGITSLDQVRGQTLATRLEDIRLITTPSSIKYLKFGSFKRWLQNIEPTFGVVKHEKPTHFFDGRMVQTHYQLLNTLQLSQDEIDEFLAPSLEYIRNLRYNPAVLRFHIKYPSKQCINESPMPTKNDIVYRLLGINQEFARTKEYAEFRNEIITSYITDLRKGKVLVEGNYSTLCGNPVEMLYATIGQFDGLSRVGVGCVVSKRFAPGVTLLGSRSPHITIANVWLTQNTANEEIERYFVMTNEILYINSIGENILQRLSGCDFDSDTVLLTDNKLLIKTARRNIDFEVPTNMIKASKANLFYTNKDKADLDIRTSVNKIGEIINLSQELNTKLWDKLNNGTPRESDEIHNLYKDIARLDVMSGCEIDKAKKILPIDNSVELKKLKERYNDKDEKGRKIRPNFFAPLARSKGYYDTEKVNYKRFDTAMDYLQHTLNKFKYKLREPRNKFIPLSAILDPSISTDRADYEKVRRVLQMVRECQTSAKEIWIDESIPSSARAERVADLRADCAALIGRFVISPETARALLLAVEKETNRDVRQYLFTTLFSTPNPALIEALRRSVSTIPQIVEDPSGEIVLYGRHFSQIQP